MDLINKQYKTKSGNVINYYLSKTDNPPLLLIHAQGTNATSYSNIVDRLSKMYNLILVDCYGHGKSSHNKKTYNLIDIGNDLIEFIENTVKGKLVVLGHSSGGLIACYIASKYPECDNLILEDPPLFSSNGERRYTTFNYKDLSSVCHKFINQDEEKDFVYYYFLNQYMWNFFPDKSRDKVKGRLGKIALKYRIKHPDKMLKVPFFPKMALEVFRGMNEYDPYFGENFYNDSFNANVDYDDVLQNIKCPTLIMKAKTTIGENGLLQGAMSDEDLKKSLELISDSSVKYFDCGHGIHIEKPKQFIQSLER